MKNPFLKKDFPVAWARLGPAHVQPAIEQALADAQERIDAISGQDLENVTFDSTLLALEAATEDIVLAWGLVGHLDSVCNSPALRTVYNEMIPKVSAFWARIPLNANLWKVIGAYGATAEAANLMGVRKRFLEETMADFREHGADLGAADKSRLEVIAGELAKQTQKFSENVLDATNAYELVVEEETQISGLPENAKEQARLEALKKGHGTEARPQWRFTLHMPSCLPAMKYLHSDGIRKQLWEAAAAVGLAPPYDNTELIWKILDLRDEKARLLGQRHFADLVLERRMAKTGETALRFIESIHTRVRATFKREGEELEAYKAEQTGQPRGPLEPRETAYWSEKLRRSRYAFDEEDLRPYFPIDGVIEGMFTIARRIFDIRITERPAIFRAHEDGPAGETSSTGTPESTTATEVWHPEVKYYEVSDADGELLGAFYADWHPRESKRGGAWMNYLMTGGPVYRGAGNPVKREPHLGLICGNLTPGLEGNPAFLTHNEVQTIFHEFGHLLHHLLGEVEIRSLNGVNVAWDFVELPSQIMENWCWNRESLDLFARHHESGAPIPEGLFEKMIQARNFQSARAIMRQLLFGKMDLELHMHYPRPDLIEGSLDDFLDTLLENYSEPTKTRAPKMIRRFSHLFSSSTGYAAGYYSYKWSEVLDADAFTRFQAAGVLNREVGLEFREKILSKGNGADPADLFRSFLGRDPDLTALLERDGIPVDAG
jgi:oligopeptidase A